MTRSSTTTGAFQQTRLPVQAKLAAAWTSFMFFYIYVDYFHLYKPGSLEEILAGRVFEFEANQTFAVLSLTLVGIPGLMILLSTVLPARANRVLNLAVAALYVAPTVFNLAGESWIFFYGLGVVVEVVLLAFILRTAWMWPRTPVTSL